ncbi:MAG: hypothetical protein IH936_12170, partial [Acidobacteria bacterium]|nr:hypothetical protein [Acidobacteriota bacterium]
MATPADGAGTGLNLDPLLMKQFRRISPSLSAGVLALALGSCGTKYLERATPAVINSGLEELISEENQERLRELAAIPDLRAAARELTQGVLEASLKEFDNPERAEKIFALTETFIDRAMAALEEAVGTELGPRFRRELALSVEEVLAAVSESASLDDLAAAGRSLLPSLWEKVFNPVLGAPLDSARIPTFTDLLAAGCSQSGVTAVLDNRSAIAHLQSEVEYWTHLSKTLSKLPQRQRRIH